MLNDEKWRERIVTWEMDLRIMEKAAIKKGREAEREELAQILREKYGMSEAEIAELKKEAADREATRQA